MMTLLLNTQHWINHSFLPQTQCKMLHRFYLFWCITNPPTPPHTHPHTHTHTHTPPHTHPHPPTPTPTPTPTHTHTHTHPHTHSHTHTPPHTHTHTPTPTPTPTHTHILLLFGSTRQSNKNGIQTLWEVSLQDDKFTWLTYNTHTHPHTHTHTLFKLGYCKQDLWAHPSNVFLPNTATNRAVSTSSPFILLE